MPKNAKEDYYLIANLVLFAKNVWYNMDSLPEEELVGEEVGGILIVEDASEFIGNFVALEKKIRKKVISKSKIEN